MEISIMDEIKQAIEIFEKYGIKTRLNKDNKIIISHYNQPKEKTFLELDIDEDWLIKDVIACVGVFDTRKSSLTTFPLEAAGEIKLYDDTKIAEMSELRAVNAIACNKTLKKLPKLKAAGTFSMENSPIKTLPKLKEVGILIAQSSSLKELPSLEKAGRLCVIDCPLEDLGELEIAHDIFLCSSDENNKMELRSIPELNEVDKLFVANSLLKTLPKLRKASKAALYNCEIKSLKNIKDAEIENHINDEELSEKFDNFTDWYNSDILDKSMDLLGSIVNQIQS